MGPKIKLSTCIFLGKIVSLKTIFMPSAKGCSKPNKPTLLGPTRRCKADINLRSSKVKKATLINKGTKRNINLINILKKNKNNRSVKIFNF